MTKEELKQEIIDAIWDATDIEDGSISLTVLDIMLSDVIELYTILNDKD